MRHETPNTERPTLARLEARLRELGEEPCGCWEDEDHVYAFSTRSIPGTLGGSAVTLHWQRVGRWYTESGDIRAPAPNTGQERIKVKFAERRRSLTSGLVTMTGALAAAHDLTEQLVLAEYANGTLTAEVATEACAHLQTLLLDLLPTWALEEVEIIDHVSHLYAGLIEFFQD